MAAASPPKKFVEAGVLFAPVAQKHACFQRKFFAVEGGSPHQSS
jgi:hypothetical protein